MSEVGIEWLRKRGITDEAVLKAVSEVDYSRFVNGGESTPAPEIAARMIEALQLKDAQTVLHVGTGSGYISAVLSKLASSVFSVERDLEQAKLAAKRLNELNFKNVQVLYGNTLKQYAAHAPYDGILVSASMKELPQKLAKRLKMQGVLVAPVMQGSSHQLVRLRRFTETSFKEEYLGELKVKPLLGDILVEMGVVDRHEVEMAALEADVKGKRLGEALLEGHYVKESDIYSALAVQNGLELWNAERVLREIDKQHMMGLPRAFMTHNRIIPVNRREGQLHLVTSDPYANTQELAAALNLLTVSLALISPSDYELVWAALDGKEPPKAEGHATPPASESTASKLDAETISFFESLMVKAVEQRASDVHFERHELDVRVRLRIDGELVVQKTNISAERLAGIVQLVKVSARMDQAEKAKPQQGHFQRRVGGKIFDIRARTQITPFGETVTLRILPQDERILTLEELGYTAAAAARLRHLSDKRSGLVLVVGPSGSGKSTTMYAVVNHISEDERRKVISVEHPVTYSLPHVYQVKVEPRRDFSVPQAVEAVLRDDADAMLIGDVDDASLARAAIRASRAGHLVVAVVTGRDSIDGIKSLIEFGVPADTVASELVAVVAQRLAKRLCPECKTETSLDAMISEATDWDDAIAFAAEGCEHCSGRGTMGRIAVTEVLELTPRLRTHIAQHSSIEDLRKAALAEGITTLQQSAQRLIAEGLIPQEELRWTPSWNR